MIITSVRITPKVTAAIIAPTGFALNMIPTRTSETSFDAA